MPMSFVPPSSLRRSRVLIAAILLICAVVFLNTTFFGDRLNRRITLQVERPGNGIPYFESPGAGHAIGESHTIHGQHHLAKPEFGKVGSGDGNDRTKSGEEAGHAKGKLKQEETEDVGNNDIKHPNSAGFEAGLSQPDAESRYDTLQARIQSLIKPWRLPDIPQVGHWPPYEDYEDKDYDPNRWEMFEWDADFYRNNGIDRIARNSGPAQPYLPYPAYNSPEWKRRWAGEYVACRGPRGKRLNDSAEDLVRAYRALLGDFPEPAIGDANATGIDLSLCFDRLGRYGPYGYDRSPEANVPDWTGVRWGELQRQCSEANRERYRPLDRVAGSSHWTETSGGGEQDRVHPQTAILLRVWEGYEFTENDMQSIRALVTETSLRSGGEYEVFLFVNVKNNSIDLSGDALVRQEILDRHVPRELHDMSVLWSERVLEEWYPKVGDWQVYWSQFMPLQWFSRTNPHFDFIWNWEMDVRYTGNYYAFVEAMASFARRQPRKQLWERNQRHYLPAVHGTYEQWVRETDRVIGESRVRPVWGPAPYDATVKPLGPTPPRDEFEDEFEWGVGEDADLLTLLPIWDPRGTKWDYRYKIWNFIAGVRPHFSPEDGADIHFFHPGFAEIPRRVYINTVSRLSRRMLEAMHAENSAGRNMQAEMWPATVALHHGLKAVYAPHPIWSDRRWPGWYADAVFNADAGRPAQWNQGPDAAYAHDREHNYGGWSWYFDATFPKSLYRRWLGWPSWDHDSPFSGIGGSAFENEGATVEIAAAPENAASGSSGPSSVRIGGNGRLCLPPMLLHPVKKTYEEAETPPRRI